MREIVFRDTLLGSVVIRSRQPGLSLHTQANKFEYEGIPLHSKVSLEQQLSFFSSHQDYDFIFITGKSQPSPPFSFIIRGEKDQVLKTSALNERIFMAQWKSHQWVGEIELVLEDGQGGQVWRLITEVVPPYLPYRNELNFMTRELERWMVGLTRAWEKPLSASLGTSIPWYKEDFEYKKIEKKQIQRFFKSLRNLGKNLEEDWKFQKKWTFGSKINGTTNLKKSLRGQSRKWISIKNKSTDTPLNRWLLSSLNRLYRALDGPDKMELKQGISFFIRRELKEVKLVPHISVPTQLPLSYQHWYRSYLPLLRMATARSLGREKGSLKDLPQLYESWVFLKFVAMVGQITQAKLSFQDLLSFEQGQGKSRLSHGQKLRFSYELPDGECVIDIWFQREMESPLGRHKPDIWLEIKHKHFKTPFIFLLDIKYQVKLTHQGGNQGFEASREAINQLHRYRDALKPHIIHQPEGSYAQKAWGAAILFPYPGEPIHFVNHPQYQQLWEEGIGAIPLYPSTYSSHKLLSNWLHKMLSMPSEGLFEQMVNYDKREHDFSIQRFSIPFEVRKKAGAEVGYWDEVHREWVGDERTPLFGEGSLPHKSNLGALDAALRYRQLHLLWLPEYLGLRLWQEALNWDPKACWGENGLVLNLNHTLFRIHIGEKISIHFLGNVVQVNKETKKREIFNWISRAV